MFFSQNKPQHSYIYSMLNNIKIVYDTTIHDTNELNAKAIFVDW